MTVRGGDLALSWWARRWMATLDGFGWAGRLSRGRAYTRNRRVVDVDVSPGIVRARVQGSRATPYRIEMTVEPFEDAVWDRVVGALARQAIYAAKLLAGELPAEVVQLCDTAEAPLFPSHPDEIVMKCSCPDWAVPCKHVAAVHYALAAELDRDPFLLFRLRGRTREELTAALRARRGSFGSPGAVRPSTESLPASASEPEPPATDEILVDRFWEHGPELDDLHFEIRPPDVPGAILRLLGRPPGWGSQDDLLDTLHDLYQVASASVRDVAFADPDEPADGTAEAESMNGSSHPVVAQSDAAPVDDSYQPVVTLTDAEPLNGSSDLVVAQTDAASGQPVNGSSDSGIAQTDAEPVDGSCDPVVARTDAASGQPMNVSPESGIAQTDAVISPHGSAPISGPRDVVPTNGHLPR